MRKAAIALTALLGHISWTASAHAAWPTIDGVMRAAQERAPDMAEARGAATVARAGASAARLSPLNNPYLEMFVDRGRDTKDVTIATNLWLPVEVNGQRGARIDESDRLIGWRERQLAQTRAEIIAAAVVAYGRVLVAHARVNETHDAVEYAKRESEYFTARLAAQDTTRYEKSLADAEVSRWMLLNAEAMVSLTQARTSLALLLGDDVGEPPDGATPNPPPLRNAWDAPHVARVLDSHPQLLALRAEQHYWKASASRWSADRNVPLNFILSAGRGDAGEPRFGGGLSWTFPFLRKNQGEVARANAEEQRAGTLEASYRVVLRTSVDGTVRSLRTLTQALEELDTNGLVAMEKVLEAAKEGYKLGKVELFRVLAARRELVLARTRRLDVLEAVWRATGELTVLSGGDLP